MKQDPEQESQLRRYLLGELRLEEQVLIGQRLFLDRDYAELAQSVEDDLIDDYVQNDLTAVERQRFETHFLKTPEHREDLRIAQAFQGHLDSEPMTPAVMNQVIRTFSSNTQPRMSLREAGTQSASTGLEEQHPAFLSMPRRRKPVVWFALAAAVLIVLSIISWIVIRSVNKPGSEGLEAQQPQAVPTEPAKQQQPGPSLPVNDNQTVEHRGGSDEPKKKSTNDQIRRQPEQQPTPATFAAVTIFPGSTSRGTGQTNQVTIKSEQTEINLKLPLPTTKNYESYRLEILSGQRRIQIQTLDSRLDELGRVVFVRIPVRLLTQKRYEIKLRGINTDGRPAEPIPYSFTVRRAL
jgi:hypothetical protein